VVVVLLLEARCIFVARALVSVMAASSDVVCFVCSWRIPY
jgi:hypothetical protein